MNKQQYEVNNLPTQIVIGHQTETGVTSIYFDCTSWLASWPDLVLGVWVTQPGGTAAYPAATHMEGDVLVWDVTDSDTAVPGTGTMEIVGIASGKKKLSAITKTLIQRTTTGTATEPPEGAKAWVDSVMQAANDAETSKSQAATYAQNAAASAEKAEENAKSVTWETLSGKPSTFPPDSHTHTLESLGAASAESVNQLKSDLTAEQTARVEGLAEKLGKTETAADSAKLGGKAPEYYLQPRNLLDNSDFTNPVNQRKKTSYSGIWVYGIDRWATWLDASNSATLSVVDGGITPYPGMVIQRIQSKYIDSSKTYTLAAMTGDGLLVLSGKITSATQSATNDNNGIHFDFNADSGTYQFTLDGLTSASKFIWAALYEGSYTADTLPPYVPKGYAAELAECRLYYRPQQMYCLYCYSGGYVVGVNFEPMRQGVIPTPVNAKAQTMTGDTIAGETNIVVTQIDRISYVENTNFTYGNYYRVFSEFSSDL